MKIVVHTICIVGREMGYRLMKRTLSLKYGIRLCHKKVMEILREKDYQGVLRRQRHVLRRRTYSALGPGYLWHADGHDKLKRFGFAIHACIDGYSRRVIWVNCASSNNDPTIIAYYYLEAIRELELCPRTLRTDCGTENNIMASIQCALQNSVRAHKYGTSQANQRIESWWCYLRKMRMQFWIDYFEDMELSNLFDPDNGQHVDILRFCFMNVLRRDLCEVKQLWNNHRIRQSRGARCPGGFPDQLFFTPTHALQCHVRIPKETSVRFMQECNPPGLCQDTNYEESLKRTCRGNGLSYNPFTAEEALTLYCCLKSLL